MNKRHRETIELMKKNESSKLVEINQLSETIKEYRSVIEE